MRSLSAIALLCLLAVASRASAADAPRDKLAQAKHYFGLGVVAYDGGQYDVALRYFQQSHALSHSPALYFNMAACEEKTDHFSAASLLLRQYLLERPNASDRAEVERRIQSLDERGESIKRSDPPHPAVATPANTKPPPPGKKRVISWALLGVTGAFAVTAVGLGVSAIVLHNRLERGCGATALGCSSSERGSLRTRTVATDAMIGVTVATAVVTTVMFVVEPKLGRSTAKGAFQWDGAGFHF